jgi:hypothetical protein
MRGDWRSTTWQKGMSSPNPGGRPKALHDVQELARQHTEAAINALAKIMNDDEAPHSARISAAEALLSRGWGRPIQPTVQAPGGTKTFEQWLDELNGPAREAIDEALADESFGLAKLESDGMG